tara:strand:+ start:2258 stop:2905 length:648 start_codon:yes stop_codon:yes gene_type:complete
MPNWCDNYLTIFSTPKNEGKLWNFLEHITVEYDDCTAYEIFKSLLPSPERASKDIVIDGEVVGSAFTEDAEDGFDGYQWCLDNWGSKWGDCDTISRGEGEYMGVPNHYYTYQTAWSPSDFKKISLDYPELWFCNVYYESGMMFAGVDIFHNGEMTTLHHDHPEMDVPKADWDNPDFDEDAWYEKYSIAEEKLVDSLREVGSEAVMADMALEKARC